MIVNRKFFNEATGLSCVKSLSSSPLVLDQVESKYLSDGPLPFVVLISSKTFLLRTGLASAAAVIKYVEYVQQSSFANASLKITYRALEGFLHLDGDSARNLELVRNLRTGHTDQSLYGVLNRTETAAGARLLRTSLLQPLADESSIQMRLGAVDEFLRACASILLGGSICQHLITDSFSLL